MTRHLILVGLSGAGKSTAGQQAARLLGCAFRDPDDEIAGRSGLSIPEIFRRRGEASFRTLERDAMEGALEAAPHVVAAGGGWAAQPGSLERASKVALVVYLRCRPETAADRLGDARERPLLASDPLGALRVQLAGRKAYYERADAVVDTDERSPGEVAAELAALARSSGGW